MLLTALRVAAACHIGVRFGVARAPHQRRDLERGGDPGSNAFLTKIAERKEQRVDLVVLELLHDRCDHVIRKGNAVLRQLVHVDDLNIIALDAADNGHEFVLLRLRRFHRQEGSLDRHNAKLQLFHFSSSMILFVNIVVKLCKKKWRTQNRRLFRYVFPSFCRFVRLSTDLIVPPFSAGRLF